MAVRRDPPPHRRRPSLLERRWRRSRNAACASSPSRRCRTVRTRARSTRRPAPSISRRVRAGGRARHLGTREPLPAPRRDRSDAGRPQAAAPWHFLYFLPLPHGHGALRGTLSETACGAAPPARLPMAGAVPPPPPPVRRCRSHRPPARDLLAVLLDALHAGGPRLLLLATDELDAIDVRTKSSRIERRQLFEHVEGLAAELRQRIASARRRAGGCRPAGSPSRRGAHAISCR